MATITTGVYVLHVNSDIVDSVFRDKVVPISDVLGSMLDELACKSLGVPPQSLDWCKYPNVNVVLKSIFDTRKSALTVVSGDKKELRLVVDFTKEDVEGIKARNKEQNFLLNALMDPDIPCVIVEGKAGSGKTLCALAAAFALLRNRGTTYKKIILTRPMDPVGLSLGALPGDKDEKFLPYLGNYFSNLEVILGRGGMGYVEKMLDKGQIEIVPMQLIGGISWHNAYVIADEVQSLSREEMYALGTRIADGSKLVLLGDSAQRYGKRAKREDTGLWQMVHSPTTHLTPLVSYLKLIKQERHPLCDIFHKVLIGDDDAS